MTFYDLTDKQKQIVRAKRAALADTLEECAQQRFCVWQFCTWCGSASVREARELLGLAEAGPNPLDNLESAWCAVTVGGQVCGYGPAPRFSFDRFPGGR